LISDLEKVPHNWHKVKFKEIAEIVTDRIDNPRKSGLEYYIGLEHLDTDEIRIKRYGSTTDVEATKFLCKKGDIIFGKRNSYLRKVAISGKDAVVSAHSMVLRPIRDKIVSEFLPCFMQSSQFWKTAQAISEGSMSPTIKWKTLSEQEFWLPDISNQGKIANILWTLEDSLEKTEKLIEVIEKFRNGLMQRLFTKGIGHTKIKKTHAGEIPLDWKLMSLGNIASVRGRIGWRGLKREEYTKEGPLMLSVWSLIDKDPYGVDYSTGVNRLSMLRYDESPEIKLQNGDILLAKDGDIGRVGYIKSLPEPSTVNSHVVVIRTKINEIDSEFLYWYMKSHRFQAYCKSLTTGTTVPLLSQSNIREASIPIPALKEQKRIACILLKADETLAQIKYNLEVKSRLKKRITNEILSGTIYQFMRLSQ
jgi:type I restriction enzyme S subunit